ncbi:MAG TPA: insulinase family protein, partial [Vicinamibacterales bacterium]|nr:insulinase family protein [Vicinamibacterales bacterium]
AGARLGPHVNAYTSFDETVYMLDLPTDREGLVERGLVALADYAGGLTLDPKEIDKERGVVIEEWRGGLGASSRVRDKQIPVLYPDSLYARRLPIGKPDVLRTFTPARLRAFYDAWYRPERMAVIAVGDIDPAQMKTLIEKTFGPLKDRAPAPEPPDARVPLSESLRISVVTDPEVTRSSVSVVRRRPRQPEDKVADYRRGLVERFFEQMLGDRFDELARRPDAKFLGAGAYSGSMSPDVDSFGLAASVQDGGILDGLSAVVIEANRAQQYGFAATELDRTRKWMLAFYERAYNERDKTESGSYVQEYLNNFLEGEPSPGIEYEYALVQQLIPGITSDEVSALARRLLADDDRAVLAVAPQKAGLTAPTEAQVRTTLASAEKVAVTPWKDTTVTRPLMEHVPEPAKVTATREVPSVGATVVTFANGVEAWLKPTDFKNDQILFTLVGPGGTSLAPPPDYPEASLAAPYIGLSGAGGLKALDLQKILAGKLAGASPYIASSSQGITGSAAPADLETALQLLYQEFTAPGDDPEAFAMLQRQGEAALINRAQNPMAAFSDKLGEVNTSNHYTARPLTAERIKTLDRAKMVAFYRDRFTNAADFTLFVVGAFKTDDIVPLLARYVGTLPSTGKPTSAFKDLGIHFPSEVVKATVEKGSEPRSQTVMSFFADPPPDPVEQERVNAVTEVLEIALRDILREDLGQTYTVSVGLSEPLPQRGAGHISISFGSSPENVSSMTARVLDEVRRLQTEGPTEDLVNRAKASALRGYETALKQNAYWLARLQTVHLFDQDPGVIVSRRERIDAITPEVVKAAMKKYLPLERYTVVSLLPGR